MKLLLMSALFLWSPVSHPSPAWPHNRQTGLVEFTGVLAWPVTARTPAQRRALTYRWYWAKVSDGMRVRAVTYPALTPEGLSSRAHFDQQQDPTHQARLRYGVYLKATATGLAYRFFDFDYTWVSDDVGGTEPLEALVANPGREGSTLAVFRQRLADAVAGW